MTNLPRVKCESVRQNLRGWPEARLVRLSDDERGVRATIHPAAGAEIASFEVRLGGVWREILYGAMDYESIAPSEWGRAPVLWPAVGRSFTDSQIADWKSTGHVPASCQYRVGEALYEIEEHGFARGQDWAWNLVGSPESCSVTCSTRSSPATRKKYPFDFKLSVTYSLVQGSLFVRYEVFAGPDQAPMPFAIGNHMYFRLPFTEHGSFDSCTVRTCAREILCQDGLGLLSGEKVSVDLAAPVGLAERRFCDSVLTGYRHTAAWFELNDPASLLLRISHAEVPRGVTNLSSEADLSFVLWGNEAVGYFCPEPWLGRPNGLNTGVGCIFLPPGEQLVWEIQIALVRHLDDEAGQSHFASEPQSGRKV